MAHARCAAHGGAGQGRPLPRYFYPPMTTPQRNKETVDTEVDDKFALCTYELHVENRNELLFKGVVSSFSCGGQTIKNIQLHFNKLQTERT